MSTLPADIQAFLASCGRTGHAQASRPRRRVTSPAQLARHRVGRRVAAARRKAGLSLLQLAQATGLTTLLIGDIEKGRSLEHVGEPRRVLVRLARALEVDPQHFLEGSP